MKTITGFVCALLAIGCLTVNAADEKRPVPKEYEGIAESTPPKKIDWEKRTEFGSKGNVTVYVDKNGVPTVYAKPQKGTFEPEPYTTPFYSIDKVSSDVYEDFQIGDIDKYTIVVWLEGNDPECIDDIIGGRVKLAMHFQIIGGEDE